MASKPSHILDASALIAYLKGEEGSERLRELLLDDHNVLAIHSLNMFEVYANYLRSDGHERAEEALDSANQFLRTIDEYNEAFLKRVARWKVDHNLSLGHAFAAALAEEFACPLVTKNQNDFEEVEKSGALKIEWIA